MEIIRPVEPQTETGMIAKEEKAECYICGFGDNYDDMVVLDAPGERVWAHRECQERMESKMDKLV